MEDINSQLEDIKKIDLNIFLSLGKILSAAGEEKIWAKEGFTRSQWIAGEVGIPILTANQAIDAYGFIEKEDLLEEGLTTGKVKLILPTLRKLDSEERKDLIHKAATMLYNDLRDSLKEKKTDAECEWGEWEHKEYWRCPKNGKRVYVNPDESE